MRRKAILAGIFLILGFHCTVIAQQTEEIFTIYLVRHAEKEVSKEQPKDPPLTECGKERAEKLAIFLKETDLDAIYSTDYIRTKNTAFPTVENKAMELEFYDPRQLEEFSKLLISRKQNALVVGHSNTTANLAGLLTGQDLGSFDESIYNRIYQVVLYKDKGSLNLFHSAFHCDE